MKIKAITNNKDIMRIVSGIFLIVLVFILNGFLSFITVGFNFDNLKTSAYWANFALLITSELAVMFGVYIIQKSKDLQKKKIVDLQNEISKKREIVYAVDKVAEAEDWLREIYNYREKLLLFENSLKSKYEKLKMREPKENEKFYKYKKDKYDLQEETKKWILEQLELIKLDKKRLKFLVNGNREEADKIILDNEKYAFKTARIKYRDVYWGNLLSDIEEIKRRESTPFFSEKKELSKDFMRYFGLGLIGSAFISALVFPAFNNIGWQTIVSCMLTAIALISFMVKGVGLSNKTILGKYYKALEKRKSIYAQMLKDLGISKIEIVEEDEK